ncbi:MAG: Imidazoleglycerol-phosphate dehydratase [Caldanaerobacter subterraneus]|jgi:imidazoleglycerol-phosphate dehydratase|uniref:Imidazoleglycerol-phosphate dehydratase n=3 Tax=Caldanaerobacter subterraneus TaxID=911092 RepID=HIS7_CALS4|nr:MULTISPECIES: imidazoleglycerol-phosphate dehydratase HisB [Caldanaerobacter]P58877.1 RecName: Full=Imidazoleglycerol-phosphate dehydratase; Short=IGPD [Caldanaerobacter subterraneus subsp. tengcongensis MB4]AAM25301.1 Imidazoleglycerol-phosphate dehydratase [Caldanaerobacter subterraneus subsp. tengcongensis MB4]KKC29036.1 imidazoleglycerol-phosphate dehydratase [Caldanaerobacter subterraneus subsp. pacificus DSM 12653]KUK09607.1 MAG: Imidazoleglycerol-phosphate dehydratase [Caldanaerobacte
MRKAEVKRKTAETDIYVELNIDGKGSYDIKTGIGFFDHMLSLFAKHGLFDLKVIAKGDLEVDTHHTVEDVGIVLGTAFLKASGDKKSIKRFSTFYVPMDEALVRVSLDISGRPYLYYDLPLKAERVGNFETETVEEFFRAFAYNFGITLHVELLHGVNTHHIIEASFKALGKALDEALKLDERIDGIPSTKGIL